MSPSDALFIEAVSWCRESNILGTEALGSRNVVLGPDTATSMFLARHSQPRTNKGFLPAQSSMPVLRPGSRTMT